MSALAVLYRAVAGLFVDDGFLALAILLVVALAGLVAALKPGFALQAGGILLFGCLGVLVGSVLRAGRR
jgi:hypothetical protein